MPRRNDAQGPTHEEQQKSARWSAFSRQQLGEQLEQKRMDCDRYREAYDYSQREVSRLKLELEKERAKH